MMCPDVYVASWSIRRRGRGLLSQRKSRRSRDCLVKMGSDFNGVLVSPDYLVGTVTILTKGNLSEANMSVTHSAIELIFAGPAGNGYKPLPPLEWSPYIGAECMEPFPNSWLTLTNKGIQNLASMMIKTKLKGLKIRLCVRCSALTIKTPYPDSQVTMILETITARPSTMFEEDSGPMDRNFPKPGQTDMPNYRMPRKRFKSPPAPNLYH
jgi:hypothetical protein